jgi:hypothetical protein
MSLVLRQSLYRSNAGQLLGYQKLNSIFFNFLLSNEEKYSFLVIETHFEKLFIGPPFGIFLLFFSAKT